MAQLTKDEIQFIDRYLKKNKVTFWDVRMELLDHVASAVEQEMEKGNSFDEALKTVHLQFGNAWKSKKLNKQRTKWIFTESIYADNSGYKKLIGEKHKGLSSQLRKMHWEALLEFFKNPLLVMLYAFLLYLLFRADRYITGEVLFQGLTGLVIVGAAIPFCITLFNLIKHGKSIYLSVLAGMGLGVSFMVFQLLFYIPKGFLFGADKTYSHGYFMLMCAILMPLLFIQTKVFFKHLSKFRKIQSKLI